MPDTKHEHLQSEIEAIIGMVPGLTALTRMRSDQEPARPYARALFVGWKKDGLAEGLTAQITALVQIVVNISAPDDNGLKAERDRLDNLLEHAFDTTRIADYSDANYLCQGYSAEYQGASGVLDDDSQMASFIATVSITYSQTPV